LEKTKNPIGKLFFPNREIKIGVFWESLSMVAQSDKNITKMMVRQQETQQEN
jgi:hypothetical protein